jgi:ribosomal protein S18 acetylase RimI-like enzyme
MACSDAPPAAKVRRFATDIPLPPGVFLRHLQAPDDYRAMNAIANAIRAAEGNEFYSTDEQFASAYDTMTESDPAQDVVIVEVDGRMVGYGRAGWREEVGGLRVYDVNPLVDAADEAVFTTVIDALEARIRVIAAGHPPGEKVLQAYVGATGPKRDALLLRAGYEPVRFSYVMIRPSLDDLPDASLPLGLEIREVLPEHLPPIWAADQEAFRDHWGNTPGTDADYEQFLNDPVTNDTSLWRVAWDGDEVAGQVRSYISSEENERFGRRRAYTENISVRRPWRRRGLARALIAASFPLLRARGMTEAALGVDAENTSGALRVYEACGFKPVSRSTRYRKPLA